MDERRLHIKNVFKVIRSVFELLVILGSVFWVVFSIVSFQRKQELRDESLSVLPPDPAYISSREITEESESVGKASDNCFIAISYNGLTPVIQEDGKIVSRELFAEQMQALKASGYQTITQQDVIDFYQNGKILPNKAMLLIFEDGIADTAKLAQASLEKNNYIATMCTFAQNLSDETDHYVNDRAMKSLKGTTYWEIGSNGYRLSYINVFDRYENYFGHLTTPEFLDIHNYVKRDYNHYLMDFLRDENRLRQETEAEMEKRIEWDYNSMEELYNKDLGYVPGLYILMHSNTGAFGNDPMVSKKNAEMMEKVFSMNFNRQGTCLNEDNSSIYDLSRLQSRQYFSTNHLMMRVWDDTGHDVQFCLGDKEEAANWVRKIGVTEYRDHQIVITTLPYGEGKVLLSRELPENLDLTVHLQGNVVGQQSIALHADDDGENGIVVRLHDNVLYIEDPKEKDPVFSLDLFRFDGGPYVSEEEEELQGKIALAKTIIENDADEERIAEARQNLATLENLRARTIEEGAEPYIPTLDIDDQDDRELRISLSGMRISCWLDGELIADHLKVSKGSGNRLALGAQITMDNERFSQTNLSDDVYDAIFTDLRICDENGNEIFSYAGPMEEVSESVQQVESFADRMTERLPDWMKPGNYFRRAK